MKPKPKAKKLNLKQRIEVLQSELTNLRSLVETQGNVTAELHKNVINLRGQITDREDAARHQSDQINYIISRLNKRKKTGIASIKV